MWYPFNFQWTMKTTSMNMKEEAYYIRGWHTFFLWIKSFCVIKNIYHSILWWYECEKGREMCDKYELCCCCGFYTRHITYNAYNTDFLPPFSLSVFFFIAIALKMVIYDTLFFLQVLLTSSLFLWQYRISSNTNDCDGGGCQMLYDFIFWSASILHSRGIFDACFFPQYINCNMVNVIFIAITTNHPCIKFINMFTTIKRRVGFVFLNKIKHV